jgi:metal-responsive CopG/Arc/MetJ family transcriptional regulator
METKMLVTFEDERAIVAQLDKIANEEGTSRATIIRQIIRRALGQRNAEQPTKNKEQPK